MRSARGPVSLFVSGGTVREPRPLEGQALDTFHNSDLPEACCKL
jgi:hypothetical protein